MSVTKESLEEILEEGAADTMTEEELEAAFLAAFNDEDDVPTMVTESAPEVVNEEETDDDEADDEAPVEDSEEAPEENEEEEAPKELSPMEELENRLNSRLRKVEGHIGGIKSQLQKALEVKKEADAAGVEAPTQKQIREATGRAGSTEKLDALKEEFPEWADALEEQVAYIDEKLGGASGVDLDGFRNEVMENLSSMTQDSMTRLREIIRVDAAFPGWEETVQTPEFNHWKDSQPEEIQTLADSPKAADAIKMLKSYHDHVDGVKQKEVSAQQDGASRKRRLERATLPKTAKGAPAPSSQLTEEEEFLAGFNS